MAQSIDDFIESLMKEMKSILSPTDKMKLEYDNAVHVTADSDGFQVFTQLVKENTQVEKAISSFSHDDLQLMWNNAAYRWFTLKYKDDFKSLRSAQYLSPSYRTFSYMKLDLSFREDISYYFKKFFENEDDKKLLVEGDDVIYVDDLGDKMLIVLSGGKNSYHMKFTEHAEMLFQKIV